MPITDPFHNFIRSSKRMALIALLAGVASTSTVSAQVVDLETSPLGQAPGSPTPGNQTPGIQNPAAPIPGAPVPAVQNPANSGTTQRPAVQSPTQQPGAIQPQVDPNIDSPSDQSPLNVDPNAPIEDLVQPPTQPQTPPPPTPFDSGFGAAARLGATFGSFSAAPTMQGDFFAGGLAAVTGIQTVAFSQHAPGFILTGTPGDPNATLAFEVGADLIPNDIFTVGIGMDLDPGTDGNADTFVIAEPVPPSDALTSPGPGFVYDNNGTAVYTNSGALTTAQPGAFNNGELWFINYSYSRTIGVDPNGNPVRPIPSPGVSVRRVKIAENFSPEVRDRAFFNFSFFNDSYGGLGDISRYLLGFEKILVDQLVSLEVRLPLAGTYASTQALDRRPNRDFEIGNTAFILKSVLWRTDQLIWSGGCGVAIPSADKTAISNNGANIVVIKNRTVRILPFTGLLLRDGRDTAFQAYAQLDVAANGDPIFGNLNGGVLPKIGVFNDSTLLHLDASVSHTVYRNPQARYLRGAMANAEIHYTGTLQESDFISANGLTYTNLKRHFNVVNATFGAHFVLGDNFVVSPGMSIPLRSGLDEQFDYEAIVQMNYLH